MFHEVATLVHLIDSSKPAARKQAVRCIVPANSVSTPRKETVPRRTSRAQLLARQSPPRHENSWRFRVDLGYVGESALSTGRVELALCTALSATSHGLGITLEMDDPGDDPGGNPDLSCTDSAGAWHGSHGALARCSAATIRDFSATRETNF